MKRKIRFIVEVIDAGYIHLKDHGSYFVYSLKDGYITTDIEDARSYYKEKLVQAEKEGWECKTSRYGEHATCKRKDKPEWTRTIRVYTPEYIELLKEKYGFNKNENNQ